MPSGHAHLNIHTHGNEASLIDAPLIEGAMDSFKFLLCLCAFFVLSTPSFVGKGIFHNYDAFSLARIFVVSGCSDETPCQPGFLCSPENKCIPAGDLITLFPNQLKDPQFNSGTASLRILQETKPLDEDGKLTVTFVMSTI